MIDNELTAEMKSASKRLAESSGDAECSVSFSTTFRRNGTSTFLYRAMIHTGEKLLDETDLVVCVIGDGITANDAVDKALAKLSK